MHSSPDRDSETVCFATPCLIPATRFSHSEASLGFFVATIRNPNTAKLMLTRSTSLALWCEIHKLTQLDWLEPIHAATYIEQLSKTGNPSVKQHLAALRMLFDWLVTGQELAITLSLRFVPHDSATLVAKLPC